MNLRIPGIEAEDIVIKKLDICKSCDQFQDAFISTCKVCNCMLEAKARIIKSWCPLGKWDHLIT